MSDNTATRMDRCLRCEACMGDADDCRILATLWKKRRYDFPTWRLNPVNECPQGYWKKEIYIPENAIEQCYLCAGSRSCPNVSTCCGGQVSVQIVTRCPLGKW